MIFKSSACNKEDSEHHRPPYVSCLICHSALSALCSCFSLSVCVSVKDVLDSCDDHYYAYDVCKCVQRERILDREVGSKYSDNSAREDHESSKSVISVSLDVSRNDSVHEYVAGSHHDREAAWSCQTHRKYCSHARCIVSESEVHQCSAEVRDDEEYGQLDAV